MTQPRIHRCTFQLRYDECNAYSYVHPASLMRIMQEAAFGASAAAGYDMARYTQIQRMWLIRETSMVFHAQPPLYGDTLAVNTWVIDFRRVRSRRAYVLRDAATGRPIVDATTDWVLIDSARQRPVTVPDEMIAAFFPEGQPALENIAPREDFPEMLPAPSDAPVSMRQPEWRDLDGAHHVNNTIYLDYLEDATRRALAGCGWSAERLEAQNTGLWPRRVRIEYKQPALLGDTLDITTWGTTLTSNSAHLHHTITRQADSALLARATLDWGFIALDTHAETALPADALGDLTRGLALTTS